MPMSTKNTEHELPHSPAEAVEVVREDVRFGAAFLRLHGRRLLLVFVGVLLPLLGFGVLAEELREGEAFFFDQPMLDLAHALARDGRDVFFVRISELGYLYGVIPADILLMVVLGLRRHLREGIFAGVSIIGSALLNMGAKQVFARQRPTLWESIAPETTFSFPSGHAMGTMTLAAVLILLAWRTRWRWPVMVLMGGFAGLVGLSRIYLGVHYPSDILAGWTAALAWAVGTYSVVFHRRRPWTD